MSDLYLRDLNAETKMMVIQWLKDNKRYDLVKAYEDGADIIIGGTLDDANDCRERAA